MTKSNIEFFLTLKYGSVANAWEAWIKADSIQTIRITDFFNKHFGRDDNGVLIHKKGFTNEETDYLLKWFNGEY